MPPPPPMPAAAASSPALSALEKENEKLRAQLREAQEAEAARELQEAAANMQKENEELRARLDKENTKLKAAADGRRAAEAAKRTAADEAKKAKQQQQKKVVDEAAANAAIQAQRERADLMQQLAAAQKTAQAEAEARRKAEANAEVEAAAARQATEAAREAAAAAAQAAAAAASLAAQQQPSPSPPAAASTSDGPSPTERAGEPLPASLPLGELRSVLDETAPAESLGTLSKGRRRVVLLFGRLDSPALAEALRTFERDFVPRADDGRIDATLVGVGVGDAPALFASALKRAATQLSYGLYLDRDGALLSALGFGALSDGLAIVVAGGFDNEGGGGALVGTLRAAGSSGAALALRSTMDLLESNRLPAKPILDAPTFASDPALSSQWETLLETLEGKTALGRGGRGAVGERGGRGIGPRGGGRGGRGRGRGGINDHVGRGRGVEASWGPRSTEEWSTGEAATPERPLGVWLPGLKRVSKLLNGTAGVRRVASSKIHRLRTRLPAEGGAEDGVPGGAAGGGVIGGVSGVNERLVISFEGQGNYGAHRLRACYENPRGIRTQELYVSCDDTFSLAELREVLRALQPVLDFVLDDGMSVPF